MPQCKKCNKFLPSDFVSKNPDICDFCLKDTDNIVVDDVLFKKDTVVKDYEIFTKQMMEAINDNEDVKKLLVDSAVKQMRKE